jgi:hypothetical protein
MVIFNRAYPAESIIHGDKLRTVAWQFFASCRATELKVVFAG